MAGEVGLEPTMVCRRRFWRPMQSPLCDSPIWRKKWDSNPRKVSLHHLSKMAPQATRPFFHKVLCILVPVKRTDKPLIFSALSYFTLPNIQDSTYTVIARFRLCSNQPQQHIPFATKGSNNPGVSEGVRTLNAAAPEPQSGVSTNSTTLTINVTPF